MYVFTSAVFASTRPLTFASACPALTDIILANSNSTLSDDIVAAGPAVVEVPFPATTVAY